VFAGVLLSVYAAVETARHVRLPRPVWLYGALLVALAVSYVVPQGSLLSLPVALRFVTATALAFAPVFLGEPRVRATLQRTRVRPRPPSAPAFSAPSWEECSSTCRSSRASGSCSWWWRCSMAWRSSSADVISQFAPRRVHFPGIRFHLHGGVPEDALRVRFALGIT